MSLSTARGASAAKLQHPAPRRTPVARASLEIVAMDFTHLEMSRDGFEDVLVITDVYSKWVVAVPLKDQTDETVVCALIDHWILNFGAPIQLHSDQGRNFESRLVGLLYMVMECVRGSTPRCINYSEPCQKATRLPGLDT
ncbi:Pol polyprotein [Elysia marginata]|uniref:Pol polyprotein n=1 Tax=Elysia marginata TaxID=1093978 RepID=A0AAV4G6X7_9GAST|nr:Pol polyprotein [Elysia marginata]